MDAVITYVDGLDPCWRADYEKWVGKSILQKRFRDWGTLRYLLRGIEECMPFVSNVHLVVARESQIPAWADRDNLHIVLHSDFVPEEYLPTFNCNPLEMYLHRIPGLSDEFIYFNDDFFPLMPCSADDFFQDGKAVMKPSRCLFSPDMYKKLVKRSDRLARKAAGSDASITFLRPQHTCAPMLKESCDELFSLVEKDIIPTLTRVRDASNLNQYLYSDYMYLKGRTITRKLSNKHFSLAAASVENICDFIEHPTRKIACINDVQMSDEKFQTIRKKLLASFEKRFPSRSRFERP